MGAPAIIAGIGTAFSVFGAIKANKEAKKQRAAMNRQTQVLQEAEKVKQRQGFMDMLNEKRKAQREARIMRAKIGAQTSGGAGIAESGQLGSIGSLSSQFAMRMGGIETRGAQNAQISGLNQQAANYETSANAAASRAAGWQSFGNMGMSIVSGAGDIASIFPSGGGGGGSGGPSKMGG
jgi:hypothetical protein